MRVKTLYKDYQNNWIFGVCAGIGRYLNIAPIIVRIFFFFFVPLTAGMMIFIYITLAIFLKDNPKREEMKAEFTRRLAALKTQLKTLDNTARQMETVVTSDEFILQRKIDIMNR